jgi:hypothetical protein
MLTSTSTILISTRQSLTFRGTRWIEEGNRIDEELRRFVSTDSDYFRCPEACLNIDVRREATAVIEPTVRFPVACPKCGRERLTEIPADVVANSLRRGSDICLVATCHDVIWTATELELEQIYEYLRAVQPATQCLPKETAGAAFANVITTLP